MLKILRYTAFILLVGLVIIVSSGWGGTGHRKISSGTSHSFNEAMEDFHAWTEFLADHSSDADYRKDEDPSEGPKHYIDIDNYYSFVLTGRIPQTFDSVLSLYGSSFVYQNGILPWATEATVNSIQQRFQDRDFEGVKVLAADLGHYVADGHMPLHITRNYDGQYTGNDGIHSRYETSMVNAFTDDIQYGGDSIHAVPDVNAYIFQYLYENYELIDSILNADNYAQTVAGSTGSQAYKQALWEKTGAMTVELMKRASHAITELLYTAWVNAGSPSLSASSTGEYRSIPVGTITSIVQQQTDNSLNIRYNLSDNSKYTLKVVDITCRSIITLVDSFSTPGNYEINYSTSSLSQGIYLISLETPSSRQAVKYLLLK